MKKILVVLFCLLGASISCANESTEEMKNNITQIVQKFKDAIKTDNPEIIADYIEYPYKRHPPLPDIKNKENFVNNYEMVLDGELNG